MTKRLRGTEVSALKRDRVLEESQDTCAYCGFPADEVDHVIPLVAGGSNDYSNLVACCAKCNKVASTWNYPTFEEKREYVLSVRRPRILKGLG